jgi:hypothetical protein
MFKSLAALAILGAMSVSAAAQTAPAPAPTANQPQPAKPQMVKKRICEENDDPSTTIHRTCRTVMVPAEPQAPATGSEQAPSAPPQPGG